jgi:prepilin-type N-terminal cleavage/methylation domain-containing protein
MNVSRRRHGFTLIELLVAVAITAVLVGLLLSVTIGTLNLWRRAQDNFTASTQAMLVLDYLERDLQAALFRGDGTCWMAVEIIDAPGALASHGWLVSPRMKPAGAESARVLPPESGGAELGLEEARFGLSGAWLRFITTHVETRTTDRPGGSLPVAVSYQMVRRPVSGRVSATTAAEVRYTLFRSAVTATTTFASGYEVTGADYDSGSPNPPATRAARSLTNPSTSGDAIATNVVDFGIWLYRRNETGGLTRIFPTDADDSAHFARSRATFPTVADVMVRILTEHGAALVAAIERGGGAVTRPAAYATDAEWWWAEVEAHSRVVVRRIEVKGAGE